MRGTMILILITTTAPGLIRTIGIRAIHHCICGTERTDTRHPRTNGR